MRKLNLLSLASSRLWIICFLPILTACPKTEEIQNITGNGKPGASPTPSASATPGSIATPTPLSSPGNSPAPIVPTATPGLVASPTPLPTVIPTPVITPTPVVIPTPTPVIVPTPTPPVTGAREIIIGPSKDARLMEAANHINQNTGAELMMWFKSGNGVDRSIIAFNLSSLGVSFDKILSAELVLTIDPKYTREAIDNGGVNVGLYRTITSWIEGNGITDGYYEGASINPTGLAVTWRCLARDFGLISAISDDMPCNLPWTGGDIDLTKPVSTYHHNVGDTLNHFDLTLEITEAVRLGVGEISWVITKTEEIHAGKNSYFTKEGAAFFGKPEIAPALKIKIKD